MKVLNFPLTQITIALLLGIASTQFFNFTAVSIFGLALIILVLLLIIHLFYREHNYYKICFSSLLYSTAFILGIAATIVQDDTLKKDHYLNFNKVFNTRQSIVLALQDKLKTTQYAQRYEASIVEIGGKRASGKVIVNFSPTANLDSLATGTILKMDQKLLPYKPAKNPDQFDYSNYLKKQHIYAQVYSKGGVVLLSKNKKTTIHYYIARLRARIITNLKLSGFNQEQLNIAIALIMGQKQELSQETLQEYQYAGAIHILSVSGLHVGLLLAFINFILKPFPNTRKIRFLKLCITIALLVFFALLAGLRPSVVRSVTMFSFIAVGIYIRRKNGIYQTLLLSMFVILLFQARFLFDVGFQLSYLAVFFILWLQPIFAKFWNPKNKMLHYFWDVLTVTFAAQLGTIPLSIYYFHQFPGLFFITNLLVIPLLTVVMIIGITVFTTAAFTTVSALLIKPLEWLILCLNKIISTIASVEHFILKNIALNLLLMSLCYLIIITIGLYLEKQTYKKALIALTSILLSQVAVLHNKWKIASHKEYIVLNTNRKSMMTARSGNQITAYGTDSILNKNSQILNSYAVANFSKITKSQGIPNTVYFKGKKILVIDSTAVYPSNSKPDVIVLIQSPQINLDRVLESLKPQIIIADASNYKSYQQQWTTSCIKMKIPFHATAEKGFYSIE